MEMPTARNVYDIEGFFAYPVSLVEYPENLNMCVIVLVEQGPLTSRVSGFDKFSVQATIPLNFDAIPNDDKLKGIENIITASITMKSEMSPYREKLMEYFYEAALIAVAAGHIFTDAAEYHTSDPTARATAATSALQFRSLASTDELNAIAEKLSSEGSYGRKGMQALNRVRKKITHIEMGYKHGAVLMDAMYGANAFPSPNTLPVDW